MENVIVPKSTKSRLLSFLQPGYKFPGLRYEITEYVRHDGFSVTYKGVDSTDEKTVLIHEYFPTVFSSRTPGESEINIRPQPSLSNQFDSGRVNFVKTAEKMQKIAGSEGVLNVFNVMNVNNTAYMVTEYFEIENNTLASVIKEWSAYSPNVIIERFLPLLTSMKAAHENELLHCDIKPENILINGGDLKLIGYAPYRHETATFSKTLSILVTHGYSPVELYRSKNDIKAHTDVFAFAALLYHLLTGEKPPSAKARFNSLEEKGIDPLVPIRKFNKFISKSQENAILNALNVEVKDRTATPEIFAEELKGKNTKRRNQTIEKKGINKWPKKAKVTALVGTFALAVVAVLVYFGFFRLPPPPISEVPSYMVRVPDFVNTHLLQVAERMEEENLQHQIIDRHFSEITPPDFVLMQDINPGSIVPINTLVSLIISGGVEMRIVPHIEGVTAEEAQAALEYAGFTTRRLYAFNRFILEGNVISLGRPPLGEVHVYTGEPFPLGGEIAMWISRGPDPILDLPFMSVVPDLVGLTFAQALEAVVESGFPLQIIHDRHGDEPANTIVSQDMPPGTQIMNDTPIGIVRSLGIRMEIIPNMQFNSQEEAEAALTAAGFTFIVLTDNSETVPAGNVISMFPAGGSIVNHGSEIVMTVSLGGLPFAMPETVGLTESAARTELQARALIVNVSYENHPTIPPGQVIRQTPSSGAMVHVGGAVSIVISSGEHIAIVPSMSGMTRASAEAALTNVGFNFMVSLQHHDTVPAGHVITQSHVAGSSQPTSATIGLIVSMGQEVFPIVNQVGRDRQSAVLALSNAGFIVDVSTDHSNTVLEGNVISQSPSGGEFPRNARISLVVSLGQPFVDVPNVVGQTLATATNTLSGDAFDFTVEVEMNVFHDTIARGNVVQQIPTANTRVSRGGRVLLTISDGPRPTYRISFVGNNGTGSTPPVDVRHGNHAVAPQSEFTRRDFAFIGWNTQANGNGTWFMPGNLIPNVQDNMTLYAQWDAIPEHIIEYVANGGTGTMAQARVAQGQNHIIVSNGFIRANYSFVNWNTHANGGGQSFDPGTQITNVRADMRLYAQWVRSGFTVFYDGNGGSGLMSSVPVLRGTNHMVLENGFTRPGFTFAGWNTAANGTGTAFAPWSSITITDHDVVLFAQWRAEITPVTSITGVPTSGVAGTPVPLGAAAAAPATATNRNITWSLGHGSTAAGANVSGSSVTATGQGSVVVVATIVDGIGHGVPFTDTFIINFTPPHVPVLSIERNFPNSGVVNTPFALNAVVHPSTATYNIISWSHVSGGNAVVSGNQVTASAAGNVTVRATIANGEAPGVPFMREFTIHFEDDFVPVTGINMTLQTTGTVGVPVPLSPEVVPAHATNRNIVWSVVSGSASISNNQLIATAPGNVTIRATIENGYSQGNHATREFPMHFEDVFVPVTGIIMTVQPTATVGTSVVLSPTVVPSDATNQNIVWNVTSGNATLSGNQITANTAGTVTFVATIANGSSVGTPFTSQVFTITFEDIFVPVTNIQKTSPITGTVGTPITLSGIILPSTATASNQNIVWSYVSGPGNVSSGVVSATSAGVVRVRATVENGWGQGSPAHDEFEITFTEAFVPATNIAINAPATGIVGTPITVSGEVFPTHATNRDIIWSAPFGGANVSGNVITATASGSVTIRATVPNGAAIGQEIFQDITITFTAPVIPVTSIVRDIVQFPLTGTVDALFPLINFNVLPVDATNRNITWSIAPVSIGSATIEFVSNNPHVNASVAGNIIVIATIIDGIAPGQHHTQEFTINFTE